MLCRVRQSGLENDGTLWALALLTEAWVRWWGEPYLVLVWVRHDEDCRRVRVHEHVAFLLEGATSSASWGGGANVVGAAEFDHLLSQGLVDPVEPGELVNGVVRLLDGDCWHELVHVPADAHAAEASFDADDGAPGLGVCDVAVEFLWGVGSVAECRADEGEDDLSGEGSERLRTTETLVASGTSEATQVLLVPQCRLWGEALTWGCAIWCASLLAAVWGLSSETRLKCGIPRQAAQTLMPTVLKFSSSGASRLVHPGVSHLRMAPLRWDWMGISSCRPTWLGSIFLMGAGKSPKTLGTSDSTNAGANDAGGSSCLGTRGCEEIRRRASWTTGAHRMRMLRMEVTKRM